MPSLKSPHRKSTEETNLLTSRLQFTDKNSIFAERTYLSFFVSQFPEVKASMLYAKISKAYSVLDQVPFDSIKSLSLVISGFQSEYSPFFLCLKLFIETLLFDLIQSRIKILRYLSHNYYMPSKPYIFHKKYWMFFKVKMLIKKEI